MPTQARHSSERHRRMTAQLTSPLDRLVQEPAVQVVDVSKTYGRGQNAVHALRNVTAAFNPGIVHRHHGTVRAPARARCCTWPRAWTAPTQR